MTELLPDPIRHTAELINPDEPAPIERRLKADIFASIGRIKPAITESINFETEVMQSDFFAQLAPPLQGIAIARCEGALAFYNRVGWHPNYLKANLSTCIPADAVATIAQRYHAKNLHDLAYIHPKHLTKILGKVQAAALWESLKRFSNGQDN